MKKIENYHLATVFDTESDGLLLEATKLHVLSYHMVKEKDGNIRGNDKKSIVAFLNWHMKHHIPVVAHNGICHDIPLLEKLFDIDLSSLMVIDTLPLSWYLNFNRQRHGLEGFGEEFGVEKPPIEDWNSLTYEEYAHRCSEDVKINTLLWENLMGRLRSLYSIAQEQIKAGNVDGKRVSPTEHIHLDDFKSETLDEYITRILEHLMFKMDCVRLQEKTGFDVDIPLLDSSIEEMTKEEASARAELEQVMPKVPKYSVRKYPAKPYKKDGTLSSSGESWQKIKISLKNEDKDEYGNPIVIAVEGSQDLKVLSKYEEPKATSSDQIKALLYRHGWVPDVFKYEKDKEAIAAWDARKPAEGSYRGAYKAWMDSKPKERAIPQITTNGDEGRELSPSVESLAEAIPAIKVYAHFNVVKHRLSVLNGFKEAIVDGKLHARVSGFTNTLRMKHAEIVNLPGIDKPYGKIVRGVLYAPDGYVLCGSDLSSLEDRTKHHFMIPYDPEYVATMQKPDYDPHLATAVMAGFITEKQADDYKAGIKPLNVIKARKQGKTCLPVDTTEVLTKGGWKHYSEISEDDSVLSYNDDKGATEFVPILGKVFYEQQEVKSIKGTSFSMEATGNHRWLVNRRTTGEGGLPKITQEYRTTDKLVSTTNIICSRPYEGGNSSVTPDEAALVGWILSDGYLNCSELSGKTSQGRDGRRQAVKCSIAQDKFYNDVKYVLDKLGLAYGEYKNNSGVPCFTLKQGEAREFLQKVGLPLKSKHDIDYTQWAIGLSQDALKAFWNAFMLADGVTSIKNMKDGYRTDVVAQKPGNISNLVILVSHLLGRKTYVTHQEYHQRMLEIRSKPIGEQGLQRATISISRVSDVFCLTTKNGNFVMRQGDWITITGNCNYAEVYNCGVPKLAQTVGCTLEEAKVLYDGYWKLNWSVKAIAEDLCVIKDEEGNSWLINPINGFPYSLRKDSDRFSTLCQGTGAYFFDRWLDNCITTMQDKWKKATCSAQFHDEHVFKIKDRPEVREAFSKLIKENLHKVNEQLCVRRMLDCETQFGERYSEIH